jgi:hypothetical protein
MEAVITIDTLRRGGVSLIFKISHNIASNS